MSSYTHNQLLVQIHELIRRHFGLEEFRDLCFKLGVGYDDLAGEGLHAKIRELITRMDRESRLDDLLAFCTRMRPKAAWPDIAAPVSLDPASASPTTPNRKLNQIFLSHAHQDSDFAHRLAADLRQHGYDIWIAPDSIRPGEQWVTAINRGLAESGIFLLALTPDAARSRWVSGETDAAIYLERLGSIQFFPLDLKPTPAPPLLATYHWVSFRDDYKTGLEMLLQALQPQKVAQLAQLYQLLQQYIGVSSWSAAQEVARQIQAQHPDYRETNELAALSQERQARQVKTEQLYQRLQTAVAAADWDTALTLAAQIEKIVPYFRDVDQLAKEARHGRRQQQKAQRPPLLAKLRHLPAYAWGGGVLGVAALFLLLWLARDGLGGHTTPTPTPTATPDPNVPPPNPQPGDSWTRPADGMGMVYVPGGTFLMGSDPAQDTDADSDEFPQHEVTLSPYWLDKTEVTNAMYATCIAVGVCAASSFANDNSFNGDDYPVVGVSWNDADAYCAWAGGQLPTEAQWEYAARGNDGRLYPWGNDQPTCDLAHYDDCAGDTVPVGSFSPDGDSPLGAADMAGNVWEWVDDWYAAYENTPQTNPTGRESGDRKVLRGGSWGSSPRHLRAAYRGSDSPTDRYDRFGFRCVVPPGS